MIDKTLLKQILLDNRKEILKATKLFIEILLQKALIATFS